MALKGSDRRYLKKLAQSLKPVTHVGKGGVGEGLVASVEAALDQHELIKVRFLEFKEQKRELSRTIAARTRADLVGMIGHVAIYYRRHADFEKRKIDIP